MELDFICIGVQKAGTTTLHNILKEHPEVYLPKNKEAHFFDYEERYAKGLEWWEQTFFNDYNGQKVKGVFTPEYLYYSKVPERISQDLGEDLKIIVILRNPVERAFSHYLMTKRKAFETLSFKNAIKEESQRIEKGFFERNRFSYIDRGFYAEQLSNYYKLFDRKNILVLKFEDEIKKNLNNTILKIEEFLGISKIVLDTEVKSNPASEPRSKVLNKLVRKNNRVKSTIGKFLPSKLKQNVIKYLKQLNLKEMEEKPYLDESFKKKLISKYYKEDIQRLEKLTKMNFKDWLYK